MPAQTETESMSGVSNSVTSSSSSTVVTETRNEMSQGKEAHALQGGRALYHLVENDRVVHLEKSCSIFVAFVILIAA